MWSVVVILLATGVGKMLSAMGEVEILAERDPLFRFLTSRQIMFIAAMIELGVAGFVLVSDDTWGKFGLIFSLGMAVLIYRLGLWAIGYEAPCNCLGAFTEPIGIGADLADWIMKGVLTYLLIGSFLPLGWKWFQHMRRGVVQVEHRAVARKSMRQ